MTTIRDYANTNTIFGGGWNSLVKDTAGGGSNTGTYGDFSFTLTADSGKSGTWLLTVTDNDLTTEPSIPFVMDFAVYLHAGNYESAFYLFDDRQINATNEGEFKIAFVNNGGNYADLSNFTLLARDLNPTQPPKEVPEPAGLLLFGIGLLGLSLSRRFKLA